jgi:hypothetical protein
MTMKWVYLGLVGLSFVTGIVAAFYWYRSSRIEIKAAWEVEPGDEQLSQAGWIGGTLEAFTASASLNAKAALWTASSVAFAALSAVAGSFAAQ